MAALLVRYYLIEPSCTMRYVGQMARMGKKDVYTEFWWEIQMKETAWRHIGIDENIIRIDMDLKEIGRKDVDWFV
jgi:hypothetical protein